jgi:hypothetical protein
MAARKKKEDCLPIRECPCRHIPLDELETRLEMQRLAPLESAVACYTDYCPADCSVHCVSGYSGCTDLCGCDGSMCAAECGALCAVDSCLVDII